MCCWAHNMDSRRYLHLAFICTFVQPGVSSCNYPGRGHCRTSRTNTTWDMTAMDVDGLCCQFHNTLCEYSQGCRDPDMANWTAGSGFVDVHHVLHGPCTDKSFSVLESPWIRFPTTSCVQFSFGRHSSYDLQVYLAWSHSSPAQRLLTASQNSKDNGDVQTERNTITSSDGVGKLLFAARGGGGDINLYVRLYNVTVQTGPCDSNNTGVCSGAHSGAGTGTDNGTNNGTGTGADNGANTGADNGANTGADNGVKTDMRDSSGSNAGAIAGAVVSVVIVVVVVVIAVVVFKRRKKSRGRPRGHNIPNMPSDQLNPSVPLSEDNYTQIDDVPSLPDVITSQADDVGNYHVENSMSSERGLQIQNEYDHVDNAAQQTYSHYYSRMRAKTDSPVSGSNIQQRNELNPNEEDAYCVSPNNNFNHHPERPGEQTTEYYNEVPPGSRKPLQTTPVYANTDY